MECNTKKRHGRPVDITAKEGIVLVWGENQETITEVNQELRNLTT